MKSTLTTILLLNIALLFSGCIEEFETDTERQAGILVINGRVTSEVGPHVVTITRTSEQNRVSIPDGGARVWLLDNQGNSFEFFQEIPGKYTLPEESAAIFPGVGYYLRVSLNGELYESPMTIMSTVLSEDSIGYRFEDEVNINEVGNETVARKYNIYLKSRTPFTDKKQYFKWEASEVYTLRPPRPDLQPCFLAGRIDPQRVVIGESVEGNELILDDVLVASRRLDDAFSVKHYTLVTQLNITEEEYNYWKNVRTSIEQVGSIFDIPPARIRGNITNINNPDELVYGYFSVAAEKTVRYSIESKDVPGNVQSLCQRLSFSNRPAWCNCVGGIARPPYF